MVQQRNAKNIAGRIITPSQLKTTSLVNSIQPVTVTSAGNIQIGNNVHSISAVQSLLNSNNVSQTTTGIRMKTNNRRNVVVGGIQSLTMNASNGQLTNEGQQTINCAKIQTMAATSQGNLTGATQLSSGELQALAGTLTAAPTIGTIQLTRNVQTLPAGSVHLLTNSSGNNSNSQTINVGNKTSTLNSIQLNSSTDGLMGKGQKIMRLSNNQDTTSQTSVGLPMSTLSALLSGEYRLLFLLRKFFPSNVDLFRNPH